MKSNKRTANKTLFCGAKRPMAAFLSLRQGIILLPLLFALGCTSWMVKTPKVILLPEERIFTIPAGQQIDVLLDKEPLSMTFPGAMKLVSPTMLVRQETELNEATFKKIKAENKNKGIMGFLTVLFGAISGIVGLVVKNKLTKKK